VYTCEKNANTERVERGEDRGFYTPDTKAAREDLEAAYCHKGSARPVRNPAISSTLLHKRPRRRDASIPHRKPIHDADRHQGAHSLRRLARAFEDPGISRPRSHLVTSGHDAVIDFIVIAKANSATGRPVLAVEPISSAGALTAGSRISTSLTLNKLPAPHNALACSLGT